MARRLRIVEEGLPGWHPLVSPDVTAGTLRFSKGAWLFAPDGVDVLLKVDPQPPPSSDGFFSRAVKASLSVHGELVAGAHTGWSISPRTGVPQLLVGTVRAVSDDEVVVDAGVVFIVREARGAVVGDTVTIAVDNVRGVGCALR